MIVGPNAARCGAFVNIAFKLTGQAKLRPRMAGAAWKSDAQGGCRAIIGVAPLLSLS